MSVDLMRLCWRVEFPSAAMASVAVKLADCANDDGENIYPSVGRIERETRLGASTVRRVLAAFEEAGLLEVVAEASGNKWSRSTTIRRFNLCHLHDLSAQEVRSKNRVLLAPSTHVLKEEIDGNRKVWRIMLRGPGDPSDYARDDEPVTGSAAAAQPVPPLPELEGYANSTPPAAGGDPSQSGSPTPPAAGAKPYIEPSIDNPPSPPTGGERERSSDDFLVAEGWARGWTRDAQNAVAGIRASNVISPIATHFIDPVRATLRPQKGADGAAFVRQLASRLRPFAAAVLAQTARHLLDTRSQYLPAAADIERLARTVEADVQRQSKTAAHTASVRAAIAADPAIASRWPDMRAALEKRLGAGVTQSWFSAATPAALQGGCLTLAVPVKFIKNWIEANYANDCLMAAQAAFGVVSRVELKWVPLDQSQPQGAAA